MAAPTMTKRHIQADFLTSGYRVVGNAQVGSAGFTGLLNDDSASFFDVVSASLARIHMPAKLVEDYDVLRLVKSQLQVVNLKRREDVGPHMAVRAGYSIFSEIPVFLTTSVYEISGIVEWAGHFDFHALLSGTRDFLPLYDVVVTMILVPSTRFECPAAFFNRQHVSTLGLIRQRRKRE